MNAEIFAASFVGALFGSTAAILALIIVILRQEDDRGE